MRERDTPGVLLLLGYSAENNSTCDTLKKNSYLFYFWLSWVFVAAHGLSLVAAGRGSSLLRCAGFSLRWLLLLWSMGSRHAGSVVVARGL